jgi:hypothetical protein
MSKYEIRKDGVAWCGFDDESCMYDKETLKAMRLAGYKLYIDGKLARTGKKEKEETIQN